MLATWSSHFILDLIVLMILGESTVAPHYVIFSNSLLHLCCCYYCYCCYCYCHNCCYQV